MLHPEKGNDPPSIGAMKYATTRSTAKAQEPSGLFRVQIDKWIRERNIKTGRMDRQIRL